MKRINTLAELKAEQRVLRLQKMELELVIKKDINELKAEMEPLRLLTRSAGKMLSSPDNSLLSGSFGSVAEFLTRNVLLRNAGLLKRLILPYLVKNTTSNLVEDNKSKIVDWIGGLINRFANRKTAHE